MNQMISTQNAPGAIGPYSQAIKAGNMLFISGQLPLVPETMDFAADDIAGQTRQCLLNIMTILEDSGFNGDDLVKLTVYLKDLNEFVQMNEVYTEFFPEHRPARAALEVARLPKDARVEIEAMAVRS